MSLLKTSICIRLWQNQIKKNTMRIRTITNKTCIQRIFQRLARTRQPKPHRIPAIIGTFHGKIRMDSYSWLHNIDSPLVAEYLKAENTYTKSFFADTEPFQKKILDVMQDRAGQREESVPERVDNWVYYSRIDQGAEAPTYCRKKILATSSNGSFHLDNREDLLINTPWLIKNYGVYGLGTIKPSHNHTLIAYTINPSNNDTLHAVLAYLGDGNGAQNSMTSSKILEVLPNVSNIEWAADGRSVFYTRPNDLGRPYQLYHHMIGQGHDKDVMLLEEIDESVFLDVSRTKDKKYITVNANSKQMSEVHVIDANRADPELILVRAREPGFEYFVDHSGDFFYIITNAQGASNYKIVQAPSKTPTQSHWKDVYVPANNTSIEDMDIFEQYCAVYQRDALGCPLVQVFPLTAPGSISEGAGAVNVPLPNQHCVIQPGANQTFYTDILRINTTSPLVPEATYDYNMTNQTLTLQKQVDVSNCKFSFNPSDFTVYQVHTTSTKGITIPITLMHQKNIKYNGKNPLLVLGYGSYGHNIEADYRVERTVLLELGWVIALCHVRGGGELGYNWHLGGKGLFKQNTFSDFAACITELHNRKLSQPALTAASGTSAGGLLVAGLCMQRPELICAAVMKVPFVDPLTAMLDPTLPLTVHEYDEWGNPEQDERVYEYIERYSPYDNVQDKLYPSMLLTTGSRDQRVPYWQPAKLTARLRNEASCFSDTRLGMLCKTQVTDRKLLLRTDWDSGHFEQGGRLTSLEADAYEYAFLHKSLRLLD